ncbi:hypothetical protein JTE90_003690 [Oedothorax gibbosus]|uniref:Major facilitator superfamily (MFS) profile domain-containing protein n=1 Tax=Oedothorax gibbosus TaxID=931172 RepID=A0AAV6VRI0_9ARAC|nr:hypothetical protein JTE90_003690 [Oedothorax gibbosus]
MKDERVYSPRISGAKTPKNQRRSFVEMIEVSNSRDNSLAADDKTKNGTSTREIYTAEDAVNRAGFGKFQVKLIMLSCFVWMARGFDSVLGMFISPLLACQWNLTRWHSALLVTITTSFSILGCICYGMWADKYGRRTALSSALIFVFVFGAVSAGLPSYTWFVLFRTVAAFSIGGLAQALTLCCECVPGLKRGRSVFVLSCSYAAGVVTLLGVLYATVQPSFHHWRLFVAVGAVPSCIAMVMMRFFPESIRYLLQSEEYLPATAIVQKMAQTNKCHLPQGTLYPHDPNGKRVRQKRGRVSHLLDDEHGRTTLLFWFVGLATAITYYSLDATTDFIIHKDGEVHFPNATSGNFLGDISRPLHCLYNMTEERFIQIVWTNALDFPGFVIYFIFVDLIDRKKLLCASCVISSIFIFLLHIPSTDVMMSTSFVFCARTLLVGQFDMLLLMAAEAYPTTERGTAVGMQAAATYVGYFATPYIVQGFLEIELEYLIGFCGIIMFLSGIASAFLTWETRRMELRETSRTS